MPPNTEKTHEYKDLAVRIAVLEQQHISFERNAMGFMTRAANEELSIHKRLDEIVAEVHKIPEMVSTKLTECRNEMREEIDRDYPRKHEVVTWVRLMLVSTFIGALLVAGMTGTMIVWDKVDQATEIAQER